MYIHLLVVFLKLKNQCMVMNHLKISITLYQSTGSHIPKDRKLLERLAFMYMAIRFPSSKGTSAY